MEARGHLVGVGYLLPWGSGNLTLVIKLSAKSSHKPKKYYFVFFLSVCFKDIYIFSCIIPCATQHNSSLFALVLYWVLEVI